MSGRSRGRRGGQQRAPYADMQRNPRVQDMKPQDLIPIRRGVEIDLDDLSGEEVAPVMATFAYFGKRFRVNPNLTETMVVDLLEAGGEVDDPNDPGQLVAAKDYVRGHLHPQDFDEFWQTALEHRQGVQAVMKVTARILEGVIETATDRPTSPPSGSSDGRRDTPTSSADGASGPVIESEVVAPRGNAREVAEHFIEKFEAEGRPDKALQVAIALESREARGLVTV